MKKLFILVGARPNFMKITRFKELSLDYGFEVTLIHSGQHYSPELSDIFFEQFQLRPDYFLDVDNSSPINYIGNCIIKLSDLFDEILKPDILLVPGDVNTTLAGAITANKLNIPLGHIESGLRSFDRAMPEEHNRIITDHLSDYLFVSEESGLKNLHNERVGGKPFFVGNTMIDTLVKYHPQIDAVKLPFPTSVIDQAFAMVTLHRPSNVDNLASLLKILETLKGVADQIPVIFPVHKRTEHAFRKFGLLGQLQDLPNLYLSPSLGYFEFQKLVKLSRLILTDSGGLQEEATFLKIPCLTLRENTERPSTVLIGSNKLIPMEPAIVLKEVELILRVQEKMFDVPPLWDGQATERILAAIKANL